MNIVQWAQIVKIIKREKMKKSLLALAVLATTVTANAATVYDKDGVSLNADGRVQSVIYNGANKLAGESDSTLQNSGRFGIGGSTKVGMVKLTAYSQWDMADGNSKVGNCIKGRDQFVQADIDKFAGFKVGRFKGAINFVQSVTDVFDDYGCNAITANDERNSGRIEYAFAANGFDLKVGYLTANDSYKLEQGFKAHKTVAVNDGASVAAGYTFDNVGFGSLSVRAGYELINGQNDNLMNNNGKAVYMTDLDKVNTYSVGALCGDLSQGFYTGLVYNNRTFKFRDSSAEDLKTKGFEWVVAYTLECGVSFRTGYNVISFSRDAKYGKDIDFTQKSVPAYINYQVTPNFDVWTEARFDLTSDDDLAGINKYKINATYTSDKNFASLGARYTF